MYSYSLGSAAWNSECTATQALCTNKCKVKRAKKIGQTRTFWIKIYSYIYNTSARINENPDDLMQA